MVVHLRVPERIGESSQVEGSAPERIAELVRSGALEIGAAAGRKALRNEDAQSPKFVR